MTKGIFDPLPISIFFALLLPPKTSLRYFGKRCGSFGTQTLNRTGPEINLSVFVMEVRKRKEYQPHRWSWGEGGSVGMWRLLMGPSLCNQAREEQTGDVSYTSNVSTLASVTGCMWLPKVTKLVQSKSGDLYLALQMALYGLCLGALQFHLQCVL